MRYFGFTVEMLDFAEFTTSNLGRVGEGGPDEVFDASFETGVDDVATLGDFGGFGHGFPVVSHGEDAMGAGDGGGDGVGVVEVGFGEFDAAGGEGLGGGFT